MTATTSRLEPSPGRDYCSRAGAEQLAADIRRFWSGFGHDVGVWVEPGRGGHQPVWIVKSTLRGGLPPEPPCRIRFPEANS
jgi:hypothetical protein